MNGITIKGTGRYLPARVVENKEFETFLDTSNDWIVSHTGIERRRMAESEATWYMGAQAAKQAIEAAGIAPDEIDVIIGTTVTADFFYPSMACLVQENIGNTCAFCFDIEASCAGFVYALDMARRYLAMGDLRHVLIVSSERLAQTANFEDRASCVLFGDGAAACVLAPGDGLFTSFLQSDGTGAKLIYAKRVFRKLPFFDSLPVHDQNRFLSPVFDRTVMDGHDVYRWATRAMPEALQKACGRAGIEPSALNLIIPHQANIRIIKTAAKNLNIPIENFYINIQDYGNTSSASVPICIDECVRAGRLKRGDTFAVVGFGAGLAYGACVLEY